MTFQIINPESLGAPKGWNNGLLAPAGGRVLFVAGQDARDASGNVTATGIVDQFAQVFDNLLTVVREAGGKPEHIGRLTIYVTDLEAYVTNLKPIGETYRKRMGRHYPAMALVQV
ncbi:MAG: RidA family protein, partial [Gemmatimonadetes bacterium]|nr:RidA family protein [Gemmatimonadota bacterium]